MIQSGEDPRFLFRRLIIFASEDVGNADPRGLELAVAGADAFDRLGMPEGRIPLAHCITYLASAPKSNRSYQAMHKALAAIAQHPRVTIPLHLRNAPTSLMKDLGYGAEYAYPHDNPEGFVAGVGYLPEEVGTARFYEPSEHGLEAKIAERLRKVRGEQNGR
jgi:putative ATPase